MIGCRSPSSLGNLACSERNTDCASLSLFCEDSCTTWPPVALVVSGGTTAAARVRGGGGAAGAASDCGWRDGGPPELGAGAPFGAGGVAERIVAGGCPAAGGTTTGRPLGSVPVIRSTRIGFASMAPARGAAGATAAGG